MTHLRSHCHTKLGVFGTGCRPIFQVLRVAQSCVEVKAAEHAGCADIYTSDQVSVLFRDALTRVVRNAGPGDTYVDLCNLADLPDVGELVLQDKDSLEALLKLRNSSAGVQFRQWFQQTVRSDPGNVAREYSKLVQQIPGVQSGTARTIRFLAQVGVGIVSAATLNPTAGVVAGAAASAIDSFMVERMFRGNSPKVFLEKLLELKVGR